MMKQNSYKKNHISFIVEEIIKSIKSVFVFIFLAITNINEGGIYVILALIILSVLKSLLKWFTIKFSVNNNELLYYTGLINKKKLEIPFDKINTIDINRNIIDRLFNVSTLKIDTGAVKELGQEIKLKINEKDVYEIRDLINELSSENINDSIELLEKSHQKTFCKTITFKEILIYSLSKSKIFWAIGGVFFIGDFILNLEETFNISITNNVVESIEVEKIFSIGLFKSILILILVFIVMYVFISIIYIIFEFVRLYNFTVTNDKNDIKIKYGLLTIKEYSIPKDKIYAIRYKQNILQQFLKIFQIEVVTVGYGDEKNEQAILYPVADKDFINSTLKLILPSFEFAGDINKPPKKALSRFIIKRSIVLIAFLIIPLAFMIPNTLLLIKICSFTILILYNILLGYLNYRNTSLGVNKELLVASSGSIEKVTTLIKQEYLQSVEILENPFQRKKHVCDFKLDIYSNKLGDIVIIKNMNKILLNNIDKNLIL
ncbi:PH domain-containing protein [Clostridium sp. AL.422]|uniref:PH domain-containing protein n=1 Tax=Clostridium TaxID=1485 RepID=UPI00293DC90E|nr:MULTISPECIES: PH domain-containing protein [unclassified Clostridium]MDV4152693.1 PH domain-containing protein [Clostridium sp. AL.422]